MKSNLKDKMDPIGSIRSYKNPEDLEENDQEELFDEIPIISSTNINEHDPKLASSFKKATKEIQNFKNKPNSESDHKSFQSLVQNWSLVTYNEAAKILKTHICYFNPEYGLVGLDKPYGLPSIGGAKVTICVSRLLPLLAKEMNIDKELLMCNRLDENTTGVMLFAMSSEVAAKVRSYYDNRRIIKQYLAITKNIPNNPTGEIDIPLIRRRVNGVEKTYLSPNYDETTKILLKNPSNDNKERKNAITKYRLIDSNNDSSLIELQPLTGFQHQIRAHLSFGLGCPILGDHKYSHHIKLAPQKLSNITLSKLKIAHSKVRYVPMHLHSKQMILPEFVKNENIFINAKLPLHFINTMKKLRLKL